MGLKTGSRKRIPRKKTGGVIALAMVPPLTALAKAGHEEKDAEAPIGGHAAGEDFGEEEVVQAEVLVSEGEGTVWLDNEGSQEERDYQWRAEPDREQDSLTKSGAAPKSLPRKVTQEARDKETTKKKVLPWRRLPGWEQDPALRTNDREVVRKRQLEEGES